jgi:hypothetical protein
VIRSLAWLEAAQAFRRRRLLALNVGIPLLLVLPVSLGGAPAFHAAAVYAVLFVLVGTFGAAIPVIRDGESGILRRMVLAGGSPRALLGVRGVAGALLDTVQLLPALVLVLAAGWLTGARPGGGGEAGLLFLVALPVLAGALLGANLVGLWVAALARSVAEGALFAAVLSLFLLHGSGVFRTPAPGALAALLEAALPFASLHRILLAAAGGAPPPEYLPALAVAWAGSFLLLLATLLLAHPLTERITGSKR